MPPRNVNSPDSLETCLNDPGYKNKQGSSCCNPDNTSAEQFSTSSRNNRTGILNTLRNVPDKGTYKETAA